MSAPGVDQRRHPRHRIRIPLYVSIEGDTYRKLIPVQSSDISAGGIAFETSRQLPLDSASRLVLSKIGGLPEAAEIEGRIVRRRYDPLGRRYAVCVAFTRLVDVTEEQLAASFVSLEKAATA